MNQLTIAHLPEPNAADNDHTPTRAIIAQRLRVARRIAKETIPGITARQRAQLIRAMAASE